MQTSIQNLNSYSKKIEVEVSAEELVPIEQKIIKNYQKSANIPGFRPGKAPLNIVRQRHQQMIQQDLIEETLRYFYIKAIEEADIKPVAEGKITDIKLEDLKNGLQFAIEVEVEPELELQKYKGLKVEKDIVEVTDDMIENALGGLQEQYATVKEVNEAKIGNYLYFNAQELDTGDVPVIGKKYENLELVLGEGKFDPEIEGQLEGIKRGEKRIVRKQMIDPSQTKDKDKKTSSLEIHIKKIEEKDFPDLNDEFVKNLNDENLESVEQLRDRIQQNMKIDLGNRTENQLRNRLIDELLKENTFDVPPSMIEHYLQEMIKDIARQSKTETIDEETVRKEYRASAIHNIRWYFLKRKLVEIENISVTDEEINKIIDESGLDDKVKNQAKKDKHYLGHLRDDLMESKVIEVLKNHAEIVEVYPPKANAQK
jgi:trigger factor